MKNMTIKQKLAILTAIPIFSLLNVLRKSCNSFLLKWYEHDIVLGFVKSICLINLSKETKRVSKTDSIL